MLLVEELQQQQQLLPSYRQALNGDDQDIEDSSSSSIFFQELARFLTKKDATKLGRSVWEVARSLDLRQHHPQRRSEDDSILVATREEKSFANERVFCLAAVWAKEEPKKSDENGPHPILIQTYALGLLD